MNNTDRRQRFESNDLFLMEINHCLITVGDFILAADTEEHWNDVVKLQTELKQLKEEYINTGDYKLCQKKLEVIAHKYVILKDFHLEEHKDE